LVFIEDEDRQRINRRLTLGGLTALQLAYKLRDRNALEVLRRMGANPYVRSVDLDSLAGHISDSDTVLHMAAREQNREMVGYLLRRKERRNGR
jgi:ankyrin repeat protein